jgi:excisionase family DNA binding protein
VIVADALLLTKKQAAAALTISERTLDRCRSKGELPTVCLGPRTVRFRPEDVLALRDAKVNTQPVPEWPAMTLPRRGR